MLLVWWEKQSQPYLLVSTNWSNHLPWISSIWQTQPNGLLGMLAKLQKAIISFIVSVSPSVHPHGTTWFPLDGYTKKFYMWMFFFGNLPRKFKYMKTYIHLWYTLPEFFLEWERNKEYKKWHLVGFSYPHWITMHGQPHIRFTETLLSLSLMKQQFFTTHTIPQT